MKKKIIILSIFTFNCCSLFHKEIKTDEAFCLNNDHDALIFAEKKLYDFFGDNIKDEKLGTKDGKEGFINGEGGLQAGVVVYGPDGVNDVHYYKGYSMSSNSYKFGAIDEGTYDANYYIKGKSGKLKSNWVLNERGRIRMLDGEINPYMPNQIDEKGEGYKTGIFIHTTNKNGYAGEVNNGNNGISVGCLLIDLGDWKSFNKVMSGVKDFKIQVFRTQVIYEPGTMNYYVNTQNIVPTTTLKKD